MPEVMPLFRYRAGEGALVVSEPHVGTHIPPAIAARMTDAGRAMADTDWNVDRLYEFIEQSGVTLIAATHSRLVADLNRDPDGAALYPGTFETALCPIVTFAGEANYRGGRALDDDEIVERRERYWRPYHRQLAAALAETKARHGYALLLDAHSIRSRVPRLFDGRLPDINLGTASGRSCAPELQQCITDVLKQQDRFTWVVNGRFKGGYITRHYGRPAENVHAVQIELAQAAYMNEDNPRAFDAARARPLQALLAEIVQAIRNFTIRR